MYKTILQAKYRLHKNRDYIKTLYMYTKIYRNNFTVSVKIVQARNIYLIFIIPPSFYATHVYKRQLVKRKSVSWP